jgi:hypothetical protein
MSLLAAASPPPPAKRTTWIAKCSACKTATRAESVGQAFRLGKGEYRWGLTPGPVYTNAGGIVIDCRACGRPRYAKQIVGRYSARHTCGARCMASTGPSCECSCGGKNHGASYG